MLVRHNSNTALLQFVLEKDKMRKSKDDKTRMRNDLKAIWEKNKEDVNILEQKGSLVKSKLAFVKGVLKEYYTNLLKQGTDCRYSLCLHRIEAVA